MKTFFLEINIFSAISGDLYVTISSKMTANHIQRFTEGVHRSFPSVCH